MNLLEIIILGIVEGLTEYLPVSSTGHLLLTESLLNMSQSKEALDALAVGTVVSWLSAWLAVKWMVSYLQKHSFAVFGWYRIAIGIVTLVLLSMGLMH